MTRPSAQQTHVARSRRFIVLLQASNLLSGVGNGITGVALPWLILERTGSPAAAGVVAAATALPLVAVALLSGTVVDLVGRRATAVVSDLLSAASILLIPLVDALGGLTVLTLAALAVLGALFDPAGASAREAMLPEAARRAGWTLDRANGVHETVFNISWLVGPGVGGLLIAAVGASGALVGTGLAFVVAALAAWLLRGLPGSGRPDIETKPDGLWRGTAEGLRFVWRERLLRPIVLLIMLVVALYYPIEGVILPVVFQAEGSPARLGVVLMALSGGMVVGTLAYERLVMWVSRRVLLIAAMVGASIGLVGMAVLPPFPLLLVFGGLAGAMWGPMGPLLNHAVQVRTPDRLRGRVTGTMTSATMASGPVGFLVVGALVETLGVGPAFLGLTILLLALVLAMTPMRAWSLLDAAPVPGSAADPTGRERVEIRSPRSRPSR